MERKQLPITKYNPLQGWPSSTIRPAEYAITEEIAIYVNLLLMCTLQIVFAVIFYVVLLNSFVVSGLNLENFD